MLIYLKNPLIFILLLLVIFSIFLAKIYKNLLFLLLPTIIFLFNELILYRVFNIDLYSSKMRTKAFYDAANITGDNYEYVDDNFTEGYYYDNTIISSKQAEYQKFDEFIKLLGIQPGDYVLDLGCGKGNLINYLKKKGIRSYGVTISEEQYNLNKKRGNNVILGDYTKFNKELVNKFDFIISTGSLEHIGDGNPSHLSVYENKNKTCKELFKMIKKYFKKDSIHKKILISTLHINPKFINSWKAYVIERSYGGSYFLDTKKYTQADCLTGAGYNVVENKDLTYHYYFSSFSDKTHFGNPFPNTFKYLPYFLIYPITIYTLIYQEFGLWMWMFDGKLHTPREFECYENPNKCDLSFQSDKNKRPVTLYWTIAKAN